MENKSYQGSLIKPFLERWEAQDWQSSSQKSSLHFAKQEIAELRAALAKQEKAIEVAARAIDIAAQQHLPDVQCNPPKEWNLDVSEEDPADGWCSTSSLSTFLNKMIGK
jgi:hypothetical protein